MQIRDNVRRRRQERIVQLLGRRPDEQPETGRQEPPVAVGGTSGKTEDQRDHARDGKPKIADLIPPPAPHAGPDLDPEQWWKQQQKRLNRAQPMWQGAAGLSPAPAEPPRPASGSALSRLAAGLAVRAAVAAVLFGAAYLWLPSDWPGSEAARGWTAEAVTRDMDFQTIEAWYERHFGGSPSFLPVFRNGDKGEAQAVSGVWKRSEAMPPAAGRIVRTFEEDGAGIRIAAEAGTDVTAAYEGRVMSVTTDSDGRSAILIRHAGKTLTTYGNVARAAVRADDWVQAGQRLGVVPAPKDEGGESLIYFSVERDDQAVDPAEVVPFD